MKRITLLVIIFLISVSLSFSKTVLKAGVTVAGEGTVESGGVEATGDAEQAFTGNLEFTGGQGFEFGIGVGYESEVEDEDGTESDFAMVPAYAILKLFLGESVYLVGRGGVSFALLNDSLETQVDTFDLDNEFGTYYGAGIGAEFGSLQIEGIYTVSGFELSGMGATMTTEYSKICGTIGFVF